MVVCGGWASSVSGQIFILFLLEWNYFTGCVSFSCTTVWISSVYTCISSLLSLLPSPPCLPRLWVITEPCAELPVLYRGFPPAVCFTHGQCCPLSSSHPLLSLCVHKSILLVRYLLCLFCGTYSLEVGHGTPWARLWSWNRTSQVPDPSRLSAI